MNENALTHARPAHGAARESVLAQIRPHCHELPDQELREFVLRMDDEYFATFAPEEVARHASMAAKVTFDHPCCVAISRRGSHLYAIVVVAWDYPSEFAIICGLLTAHGLDIREGNIFTYGEAPPQAVVAARPVRLTRPRRPQGTSSTRKKIVDYFIVRPLEGPSWPESAQARFADGLEDALRLLDQTRLREARAKVNRALVERLSGVRGTAPALLHPVQIRFDNQSCPHSTVMDIRSTDTPAFLYAFSNALALRGVYVHKAHLENVGQQVRDRLYVRDRHGKKITDPAAQHELRVTAVWIKQFTQFLRLAPDPGKAIEHFDQFLDRVLTETTQAGGTRALAFLSKKSTLTLLARLLGTSDFLWEDFLRRQHANLLPLLTAYRRQPLLRPRSVLTRELRRKVARASSDEQRRKLLNTFKDRELFRIDMKHLSDESTSLQEFSQALTELAEVVLEETLRAIQRSLSRRHGHPRVGTARPCPFTILGMGKFGGRELGYASDIEVLFVYKGAGRTSGKAPLDNSEYFERLAQELLKWIEAKQEGIFHIDVRLRPHGGKGQLANTLQELRRYYGPEGLSAPFERQALIKLRHVAGDASLGREVERLRDTIVYSGRPWDVADAVEVRRSQIKQLVAPSQVNVKHSPGGLIDIEYAVQYLQLMHGHRHRILRTPNTLEALVALGRTGILTADACRALREAYLLFRTLIDGLRIVRGHAKDLVLPPPGSDAYLFLARRVGYASEDWQAGAAALEADLATHMARTRQFYEDRFGPLGPAGRAAAAVSAPSRTKRRSLS